MLTGTKKDNIWIKRSKCKHLRYSFTHRVKLWIISAFVLMGIYKGVSKINRKKMRILFWDYQFSKRYKLDNKLLWKVWSTFTWIHHRSLINSRMPLPLKTRVIITLFNSWFFILKQLSDIISPSWTFHSEF